MFISPTTNYQYEFFIDRYFTQVLGIQYRLADQKALRSIMSFLAQQNPAVKSSISLLSVLHIQSQANAAASSSGVAGLLPAPPRAQKLYDKLYEQTRKLLQESTLFKQGRLDEGDAMACLHLISAFLFSGGRGTWWEFLDTAGDWVEATICDYGESPHLALLGLSERGRFIFRATMWMDVFSGVSLCRPPRFLRWYQQLFRPGVSLPEELGMDRIMGCPNDVILAFAETTQLEHDKQCETAACTTTITTTDGSTGNESVTSGRSVEADMMLEYMLRGRGMQIETYIPEVSGPVPLPSWERFVELRDTEDGSTDAEIIERDMRLKVAEVFKQAARVYLHSVVEGCDPQVPTIRRAVLASINALTVRISHSMHTLHNTHLIYFYFYFAGITFFPTGPRSDIPDHHHRLPGRDTGRGRFLPLPPRECWQRCQLVWQLPAGARAHPLSLGEAHRGGHRRKRCTRQVTAHQLAHRHARVGRGPAPVGLNKRTYPRLLDLSWATLEEAKRRKK